MSSTEFAGPSKGINQWLAHNDLSRSMWYKLKAAGKAPKTFFAGNKELISADAHAAWLRERALEAQEETTKLRQAARSARARAIRLGKPSAA